MSIAQDLVKTKSFRWHEGALAVPFEGYRVRIRVTDANTHLLTEKHIPVLKDWGTIGMLLRLIAEHPAVYRVTKMSFGHSAMPERRAEVEVSLHKAVGFSAHGKKLGEVLARVLIRLDQEGA